MKTKIVRIKIGDALKIEQTSRELAAELQKTVTVSDVIHELTEDLENGRKRIQEKHKNKIKKTG